MNLTRFYDKEQADKIGLNGRYLAILSIFGTGSALGYEDVRFRLEDAGQSPRHITIWCTMRRMADYGLLRRTDDLIARGRPAHVYVITSRGVEMLRLMEQISDAVS